MDALKKQQVPALGTLEKADRNSLEDMRTQVEVLRQQVRTARNNPEWVSYSINLVSHPRIVPRRLAVQNF